ncbi:MAG: D-alanine--D-alanine ligase [Clostridia bacterium]|nr:D-alanine--D-alanine ligase [Clostridia bacterium]
MKIMVLYGGESDEREVSLHSGTRVACALRSAGHQVECIDYRTGRLACLLEDMRAADAVFLALHGGTGEDGSLQAALEKEGILHYTGSGPHGAAIAMEKAVAKACVSEKGVPVARGVIPDAAMAHPPFPYPVVLKPRSGGSSVGLRFVRSQRQWRKITPLGGILCEEYLPGREYTVGVFDGRALPAVEIRPIGGAYDYEHKYTVGASEELCPAPLPDVKARLLSELALCAFAALSLRDYARIDFREDGMGNPRFLEANTLPGMTETSLFPLAAKTAGIEFPTLCEKMAALAAKRKKT